MHPTVDAAELSWITAAEMREIDRVMVADMHIELVQMMENAGRALAEVVGLGAPSSVTVLAGSGGNGGGGLVAARHLANVGVDVRVVLAQPSDAMTAVPAHQLDILERGDVSTSSESTSVDADVVVDALVGYSLRGPLRGRCAELVEAIPPPARVISLDVPSGVDATTGAVGPSAVRPDATVTLCLPKTGLRDPVATGELFLADISVPPQVTATIGGTAPPFARGRVLRVTGR
ncbi:MAG: NAD(P)H-hydrate epimerase [Actinomycetota bacterium]